MSTWSTCTCSFASPWTSCMYITQTHYAKVSLLLWHKIHSHVNLELIPEHKSKVIQNHERQLNVFKKKYMYCNFWRKTYNKTTRMLAMLKRLDNGFRLINPAYGDVLISVVCTWAVSSYCTAYTLVSFDAWCFVDCHLCSMSGLSG